MFCFARIRNRDEDEGIPSENEEEKKMLDTKARELKGKVVGGGLSPSSVESAVAGDCSGPSSVSATPQVQRGPPGTWKQGGE